MKRTTFLLCALLLLGAGVLRADRPVLVYDLTGTVVHGETPMPNVTVTLSPGDLSMKTNDQGQFEFWDVEEGIYSIRVNVPGYLDSRTHVRLVDETDVTVHLFEATVKPKKRD